MARIFELLYVFFVVQAPCPSQHFADCHSHTSHGLHDDDDAHPAQVFGVEEHETVKLTEKIVDCKIGSTREAYHKLWR